MLRAGLIGFPSSGKTALFQLLTSAREAPRAAGKSEAHVGVSRVPDERLDQLTALFNPRKHVPATVEFADVAGVGGVKTGAAALLDVISDPDRPRTAPIVSGLDLTGLRFTVWESDVVVDQAIEDGVLRAVESLTRLGGRAVPWADERLDQDHARNAWEVVFCSGAAAAVRALRPCDQR